MLVPLDFTIQSAKSSEAAIICPETARVSSDASAAFGKPVSAWASGAPERVHITDPAWSSSRSTATIIPIVRLIAYTPWMELRSGLGIEVNTPPNHYNTEVKASAKEWQIESQAELATSP